MQAKGKRIVISGGPGFGKTSILNRLQELGYTCFPEISRSIIQDQLIFGGDILPWKNLEAFSRLVFEKRVQQYTEGAENLLSFYDRGIPDVLAYLMLEEYALPEVYTKAMFEYSYNDPVFITPPWQEIYTNDAERKESFEKACRVHEEIHLVYSQLGYRIIDIPKTTIDGRLDFIINTIKDFVKNDESGKELNP
jgi:predicted ATPase